MRCHDAPLSVVSQMLSAAYAIMLTTTRSWSFGSIAMLLIQRSGSWPSVPSICVHVGDAAVPFDVR